MSFSKGRRSRKILVYEAVHLSQRTGFDIGEYIQNPSMIKMLHKDREDAHAYSNELELLLEGKINANVKLELHAKEKSIRLDEANKKIKNLEEENKLLVLSLQEKAKQIEAMQENTHQIQIKLTRTEGRLEEVSRSSFVQFLVSIMATVLLSFGVNIVTTTLSSWIGWILVVVGIILSIVAFIFVRKSK